MIAITVPGITHYLSAPTDWNEAEHGRCETLPVIVGATAGHIATYTSFWRPSSEELAALNSGGRVALTVFGPTHPPVAMAVRR
jgi:hypothetical protein